MMSFVNKVKRLINKSVNTEPTQTQEAMVTETGRVLSDHPVNKITPAKLKSLLEEAENGDITAQHELFMDIEEQDSNIAANIQTRKRAILTLDWRIAEARNATAQSEQWREEIEAYFYQYVNLEDLLINCMDAVGHGFSALEIEWLAQKGKWLPYRFIHRPPSWFRLDKDDNLLLKTPTNSQGEPLRPLGWVVHIHQSRSVQLARMGLYRTLAWLYMFKHYSVRDFAEFLELYGMPIRIGKYGAGATLQEKQTLLRALAQIGHNAAGIMPESMQIELHDAAIGGQNNPFLQMVDWCEKSIARLILGQTLTSGADGKSSTNALGNVHNEVRRDLLVSDAKQIAKTISQQIILPYLQININPVITLADIPYFEFDTKEREDLSQYAEAIPKLVSVGVQIPESWTREKLGIPEAQEDELILSPTQSNFLENSTALSVCPGCGERRIKNIATLSQQNAEQDKLDKEQEILDESVEQAFNQIDFNQQLDPMVQQAVALLQNCNDYEDAFEQLSELYPQLDTAQHQRYLTQALFVSELLGVSREQG